MFDLKNQKTDHDTYDLTRELDRVKSKVFLGRSAAFLGTIMSSLNFQWNYQLETAATDGENFWWNPNDFLALPAPERGSTVEHELWHVARLHMVRGIGKNPKEWNIACDIRINRDLRKAGHHLPPPMWIQDVPECPYELEEEIYDWLVANPGLCPSSGPQDAHMKPGNDPAKNQTQINNVVKAINQAKIMGQAGSLPGDLEQIIDKFLAPVIPWETLLYRWMEDMLDEDYNWKRPNRRHQDIYLPSRFTDDGRLEHLIYYLDVSGSITDGDTLRFNSEVKYIKDTFNPVKLTLVQFDTRIVSELVITEDDAFEEIVVKGRGGTDLRPVREHIIKHQPTAAIIFTDLEVTPMQPLPFDIPVLWVTIRNRGIKVPFGEQIHIKG